MSKVKESLEANMDFIRSQLPDDLKEHADTCIENCEVNQDDIEITKQQIIHSLPDALKSEVDIDSVLPAQEATPTLDEQKAMVLAALPSEFHADFEKSAEALLASE